jgi:hypothetical protein
LMRNTTQQLLAWRAACGGRSASYCQSRNIFRLTNVIVMRVTQMIAGPLISPPRPFVFRAYDAVDEESRGGTNERRTDHRLIPSDATASARAEGPSAN